MVVQVKRPVAFGPWALRPRPGGVGSGAMGPALLSLGPWAKALWFEH